MRSWRIFNREQSDGAQGTGAVNSNSSDEGDINEIDDRPLSAADGAATIRSSDGFIGFRSRSRHDARAERSIALAARTVGDGVQAIVSAAKVKENNDGAWKQDLLNLLEKEEVDTLLQNASNDKFVLRCVENELPPNLVHCLRLLRVLELQHASNEEAADTSTPIEPIGKEAAEKVSKLLCLCCKDASVGEQLRPHLFGLFALSGASYPPSGAHVAKAASDAICAFSEHCLTRQLVWFIHDRKMILHMTDDIRELAGLQAEEDATAASVPNGLSGSQAEDAGLWFVAFRTVVSLVFYSCNCQSNELVKDLSNAGGFDLYRRAVMSSSPKNIKHMLELLPKLLCCPEELPPEYNSEMSKLVSNNDALDIVRQLMLESNLLLQTYSKENPGQELDPSVDGILPMLSKMSIQKGIESRVGGLIEEPRPDIATELFGLALPMFSDHPNNYDRLEGEGHMLTFYLLALPCFQDDEMKEFVLKTLEFVLTAVGVGQELTPVMACVEIFFSMCLALLSPDDNVPDVGDREASIALITKEVNDVGKSFEKLLQFDERVAPTVIEAGALTTNLKTLLDVVVNRLSSSDEKSIPASTPLDSTFSIICRVLRLLVSHRQANAAEETESLMNIYQLLSVATLELGIESCHSACSVFDAVLVAGTQGEAAKQDFLFVLDLTQQVCSISVQADESKLISILKRATSLLGTFRSVLDNQRTSRDVFRECGGFSRLPKILLAFHGQAGKDSSQEVQELMVGLFRMVINIMEASVGAKARATTKIGEAGLLSLQVGTKVDPLSSRFSLGVPSALNCDFIRREAIYLDLAAAFVCTDIFDSAKAQDVIQLCLTHVDPSLDLGTSEESIDNVRNPDAVRLILGVAMFLDSSESDQLIRSALDIIHILADQRESTRTTLPQLASCGMCASLTNHAEFAPLLFSSSRWQPDFMDLLLKIASFRLSHAEMLGLLRCLAGPVLLDDPSKPRIRLPVISSSITHSGSLSQSQMSTFATPADGGLQGRINCLAEIASSRMETPHLKLGGDSVNTIAVLMHQVPLEDRLTAAAEDGRLNFLEIESLEISAQANDADQSTTVSQTSTDVWNPLVGSGFSYSIWIRHDVDPGDTTTGNLHILDISTAADSTGATPTASFLSIWYDLRNQRFNAMSSASYRGEPICFPVSPLSRNAWHHVLVTYSPAKRTTMLSRKSAIAIFVDGRPLEADIKVDSVNLPPSSKVIVGAPNPALAISGIVKGRLPLFDFGPTLMIATVLLELDATSIFSYGPQFPALLWGDRPQRRSLVATSTLLYPLLGETGESGSVASALRRRGIGKLEGTSHVTLGHSERDELSSVTMFCSVPPEALVFAFNPRSSESKIRGELSRGSHRHLRERIVNLARLKYGGEFSSTDAILHGKCGILAPLAFGDSLQWIGGPIALLPLVAKSESGDQLAKLLQVIREGTRRHVPNLEMMQAAGGYRMLAVLLREKPSLNEACLYRCLSFAVDGFDPAKLSLDDVTGKLEGSERWVLSDLDALKHVLLNHQVWDLKKQGPAVSLKLLQMLNHLVSSRSFHKAFNARRIHSVGIVRWALHLMIEASELYDSAPESSSRLANSWFYDGPTVADVSVGGDPGSSFLFQCKTLLRRVLTFMLTPQDLEALSEAIVFTVSAPVSINPKAQEAGDDGILGTDEKMPPVPTMRLYLVRLLEELVVDGVNEIVSSASQPSHSRKESKVDIVIQPHAAGVASPGQPYFRGLSSRGRLDSGAVHPKDQQAQAFLSAFANFLTPVWFATVLEGCREEASTSAVLRLMILMLQGSSTFEGSFRANGSFAPFVLSIPRFSTSASISITMLSQLFNLPILHLHSLPTLDPDQLCEIFDVEASEVVEMHDYGPSDPTSGIFGLIAEVLGRNIRVIASGPEKDPKAQHTNKAIFELLARRHESSASFRAYCRSPAFLEPLSQALCLVYDESSNSSRPRHRALLADVPRDLTPTERFVGGPLDSETSGAGMVRLFRMVLRDAIRTRPKAAVVVLTVFNAFPIHASAQQVEAFHLVLVEQCKVVVKEVLENGSSIALSNIIGLSSVLLEQISRGFLTSESMLDTVKLSMEILSSLVEVKTNTISSLSNQDYSMLVAHSAYFARLISTVTLHASLPTDRFDPGDDDLQSEVLALSVENLDELFLLPSRTRPAGRKLPTDLPARVGTGSKQFPLWESLSIGRCSSSSAFPDASETEYAEIAVIAPMLVSLHRLLIDSREDVRGLAVSMLVSFLQHRPSVMSELLVAEVSTNGETETVDVVNRGGFRALLIAHETASTSDQAATETSVKRKYAAFFEWLDRNQVKVEQVFRSVEKKSLLVFPGLETRSKSQAEAVERKQKTMLMKLSSQGDRTILGGLERADLCRRCAEKTIDSHASWRRQGVDDLAAGASCWKVALRQLKGAFSIWEGSSFQWDRAPPTLENHIDHMGKTMAISPNLQLEHESRLKWKLDLSEGFERQRRRLLPNYEFHGLYNIEEDTEQLEIGLHGGEGQGETELSNQGETPPKPEFFVGPEMEATTELLKDLNVKRASKAYEEFGEEEDDDDDLLEAQTISTVAETTVASAAEVASDAIEDSEGQEKEDEVEDASSYDLIHGLLKSGDWPERSYNVMRCTGLEVAQGLLLWTSNAIYIIDGFEQSETEEQTKISRVEKARSSFHVSLRGKDASSLDDSVRTTRKESRSKPASDASGDVIYQHRSQRIAFADIYCVYRRRYQLQQNGLEFYDRNNNATLIAFDNFKSREELLSKVLQVDLPNSVFHSSYGATYISYGKFMSNWKARIISDWRQGKVSNFDFLMHLNTFAGRSFNDLTQYPVFPWIIADYDSEEIDLSDPKTYRDLSKPMGAIGPERARQFHDRYEALASCCTEEDPPPFHYGTHYSCAAYVLYYLMRLEPFSRMALALQGGKFDVADRLFHDVGRSWKSASSENLQDVRELIPEFFYLPDLFMNTNGFDFGQTQSGKNVHDVTLPKWAKGDPKRFVRINRQALESPFVSKQLHQWVDLIFGHKQRGEEAVNSLNQFVHLTYEGEVDLDTMTDPVQRASTIAQIQNFGQTPSRLQRHPFAERAIVHELNLASIDYGLLPSLTKLTPPFCIVGAPHAISLRPTIVDVQRIGMNGQMDMSVGDVDLMKGQVIAAGSHCYLNMALKRYIRFGGACNGVTTHTATASPRQREVNKIQNAYDSLHQSPISAAKTSTNGAWLVTGCVDSTVRVWQFNDSKLSLLATLTGHDGWPIISLDLSVECGVLVTACERGRVLLWDLRTLTYVRCLCPGSAAPSPSLIASVSINNKTGSILVLVGAELTFSDINGFPLAVHSFSPEDDKPTCAVATDCPEYMEDGVSIVTGHASGEIRLWSTRFDETKLRMRHKIDENPHTDPITVLRATGIERQDCLLVGDSSGKVSAFRSVSLTDNLTAEEKQMIFGDS